MSRRSKTKGEQSIQYDKFAVSWEDLTPVQPGEVLDPEHRELDEDYPPISDEELAVFFDKELLSGVLMEGPDRSLVAPVEVDALSPLLDDRLLYIALLRSGAPLSRDDREHLAVLLERRAGRPPSGERMRVSKAFRAMLLKKLVRDETRRLKRDGISGGRDQAVLNVAERFGLTEDSLRNGMKGR